MEDLNWLIACFGVILILFIVYDIMMTVLHIDNDGPVAQSIFQIIWWGIMKIIRMYPKARRNLVAIAGPMMIVSTVAIWLGLFILGFALIYWPFLDHFYIDGEASPGFILALYFSGVTTTVTGYGDLTPLSGTLQITAFLQAGLGFALITGILTYLINVVSGVSERNALALRLWAETGRTGSGTVAVLRSLDYEEVGDLRLRLQTLLVSIHTIHQKMHQFPILDLFYRSKEPVYSPEFMIRSAARISIATQILSADKKYMRLKTVAEELGDVSTEIMTIIAEQYMSHEILERLKKPDTDDLEQDMQQLKEIRTTLIDSFPRLNLLESSENKNVLDLIYRLRIFLDEADKLTGWRMDDQDN